MTAIENQKTQLRLYMEAGNTITQRGASRLFDCDRLGARVYDLKRDGVEIRDEWEYKTDESGKVVKKWKKYWIA